MYTFVLFQKIPVTSFNLYNVDVDVLTSNKPDTEIVDIVDLWGIINLYQNMITFYNPGALL